MAFQLKWTPEAKLQFKETLDYWEDRNGSAIYSMKLITLLDTSLVRLTKYPEIGRPTENEMIRLKIIKDYFLYYSYDKTSLTVLGVSDMLALDLNHNRLSYPMI